jgi:hypothetical protein
MSDSDPPSSGLTEGSEPEVFEEEESSKSRTGRFQVQHRGGTRIEVGDPIKIGGPKPWMCAVKLVGHKRDDSEPEPTQTLLVRTGRGDTPEEAQREAIAHLTLVYGSPVAPPPMATIELKASQRPSALAKGQGQGSTPSVPPASGTVPSRPSFIDMLKGVFKKK